MARYWFKPHDFGYGATPVTWQGWALTASYVVITGLLTVVLVRSGRNDASVVVPFLAFVFVSTIALVVVARWKTEGGLALRWGKDNV
jgi:hypothetical protein